MPKSRTFKSQRHTQRVMRKSAKRRSIKAQRIQPPVVSTRDSHSRQSAGRIHPRKQVHGMSKVIRGHFERLWRTPDEAAA